MKYSGQTYTLSYDPLDQQVNFDGIFRLASDDEVSHVFAYLARIHDDVQGTLRLSFRRLRYINAEGMRTLSLFVAFARGRDKLQALKVIASGVLAWSVKLLPNLSTLWERVEFSVYDHNFYESQQLIEDNAFIPLLRNQTRVLWPQERSLFQRHGLTRGMRVADICCGCGDVPLLIARELAPSFVIGVDHSEAAVTYARSLQQEFGVHNTEFQRGDATALMLDDNSFDFVSCRLSLQIFSRPDQILRELIRITRPGGRIYVTGEDYDLIIAHPEEAAIQHTYQRTAAIAADLGIDLRNGRKLYGMLSDARLDDLRVDQIVVDTANTPRDDFAAMIEQWRTFATFSVGSSVNLTPAERDQLLAGYDAHLRTIKRPNGYTAWTTIACSGRKPLPSNG
jgi:ubiquinone/menaquinone biosynthesis C-methylase UbiE